MYGETKVRPFFELPGTLENLEFLGPGEVMANVNLVELSSQAENGMPSCDSDKE